MWVLLTWVLQGGVCLPPVPVQNVEDDEAEGGEDTGDAQRCHAGEQRQRHRSQLVHNNCAVRRHFTTCQNQDS